MTLVIRNRDARRLWLAANGLSGAPTGPLDLMGIVRDLGFVQIDTIRNVTRAHNHILWSRNRKVREGMVWKALAGRDLFEHFTHDASLIPMEVLPFWQRQFRRKGELVGRHDWYQSGLAGEAIRSIRDRIAAEGPLSTHAFDTRVEGAREMWARPPHKKALDQMWYAGVLATSHRENFVKYYDLGERVFPGHLTEKAPDDPEQVDWLCRAAMDRLWVATPGEVQRFWAAVESGEVKDWIGSQRNLIPVEVEGANGSRTKALALPDIEERLTRADLPGGGMRLLNPFDPAIRDRNRLERLFGFDYRNEMFVPADQRRWGYYVYPLLEGDRLVGRIEVKGERAKGMMSVTGFWPDGGVTWGAARGARLAAELERFARFAGLTEIAWTVPAPAGA
jgi:uncharacterized protein YcaQ